MRWERISHDLHRLARRLVTPQLMRKAVRLLAQVAPVSVLLACGDTTQGPVRVTVAGAQTLLSTESELLGHPTDLAVDDRGRLYVLDGRMSQVVVLDSTGGVIRQFGRPGAGPGELNRPGAMAVRRDTVVVLDSGNGRIQRWHTSGQHIGVQPLEDFAVNGPTAVRPSGQLAAARQGWGDVLVAILGPDGTPQGGVGTPVVEPPAFVDAREMRRQILDGQVPDFLRNMVMPVWHSESELWLLLQAEGLVERHNLAGALLARTPLELPEADLIRDLFVTRNQESTGLAPLAYASDAEVVRGTLWILLNLPDDHPAVIVQVDDAGAVVGILEFSDVHGARTLAVDAGGRRVYFGIPSEASILVAQTL